jgi:phosphopantothenate-cysteine ligase
MAAAISDFYIPASSMSEHKLQSSEGAPDLRMALTPKILPQLLRHWAPEAFIVR